MSDSEDQNSPAVRGDAGKGRRGPMLTTLLAVCALIGGGIGGTGAYALANAPWHHGFALERVQSVALRALDGVGATTAQETKIHDILATTFSTIGADAGARQAAATQMLALLRAPAIDRSAVERLRAAEVATFDLRTKTIVGAVLEAADQLTPDQRGKLADRVEAMMKNHQEMQRDEMRRDKGPDGGHGPKTTPDGASGKG